jgi:hypothetical protein
MWSSGVVTFAVICVGCHLYYHLGYHLSYHLVLLSRVVFWVVISCCHLSCHFQNFISVLPLFTPMTATESRASVLSKTKTNMLYSINVG